MGGYRYFNLIQLSSYCSWNHFNPFFITVDPQFMLHWGGKISPADKLRHKICTKLFQTGEWASKYLYVYVYFQLRSNIKFEVWNILVSPNSVVE